MLPVTPDPSEEPCPSCGVILDTANEPFFSLVRCPQCRSEVRVRRSVGPYELLEIAGQGGSGKVFRACRTGQERDRGAVSVALKILESKDPDYQENLLLLRNEALCARMVDHPGVVRVLDLTEDAAGACLVMEFMEGGSLHDRIVASETPPCLLDEGAVLRTGLEILAALEAAQARGIIHRDLKPANILFTGDGRAKLGDFGLARSTAAEPVASSHLLATPDYVAPEVLEGAPADFRSDLYGLGCCLFHAITSVPPYPTEGRQVNELLSLKRQPIPLVGIAMSPMTRELLAKMADPDPLRRFSSAGEAKRAMEAALHALASSGPARGWLAGIFGRLFGTGSGMP
jgi:eukaryotic-like serine/threonine-protein kinase